MMAIVVLKVVAIIESIRISYSDNLEHILLNRFGPVHCPLAPGLTLASEVAAAFSAGCVWSPWLQPEGLGF